MTVSLRNKSNISRRLRILPPASSYFSISELRFPHVDGLLAPGMACHCTVRFSPDSLADYEDSLTAGPHTKTLAHFSAQLKHFSWNHRISCVESQ